MLKVRKFKIILQEVEDHGITAKECAAIRDSLNLNLSSTRINLAWCNAMLDANITSKELTCSTKE